MNYSASSPKLFRTTSRKTGAANGARLQCQRASRDDAVQYLSGLADGMDWANPSQEKATPMSARVYGEAGFEGNPRPNDL